MKKFKLCYYDDTRIGFKLNEVVDVEFEKGKEVFEYVIKEIRKNKDLVRGIKEFMGGFDKKDLLEGSVDNNRFNVLTGEEGGCFILENYEGEVSEKVIGDMFYDFVEFM